MVCASPRAGQLFLRHKKIAQGCYCILKNKKKPRPDIIETELKKIIIVNPRESKCRMMKSEKKIKEKKY
jgi:hypothetical protein